MGAWLSAMRAGPRTLGWRAMPWFIRQATRFSALFVGVWLLLIPFAALNLGTYSINGVPVTGPHMLMHGYPEIAPVVAVMAAMAYGGWTERLWARWLPFVFAVAVSCYLGVQPDSLGEYIPWAIAYLVFAGWYSFFKRSVAEYYSQLSTKQAAA